MASVTAISSEDLADRLTPEARTLFCEMVDAHLTAGSGDRLFIRGDTMDGTGMIFSGPKVRRDWHNFDGGAINDLVSYILLHQGFGGRGSPTYRISGEGLHFYRTLMDCQGSAFTQMEDRVQHARSGDAFAKAHPRAAHHLREAFDLLWQGNQSEQVVSEIGDHLRKGLIDMTTDVLGTGAVGAQEKPVERLKGWISSHPHLGAREADVLHQLAELVKVVLRLDNRLNHMRDEADKGEQPVTWEEVRRAAFATTLVCYELDRVNEAAH